METFKTKYDRSLTVVQTPHRMVNTYNTSKYTTSKYVDTFRSVVELEPMPLSELIGDIWNLRNTEKFALDVVISGTMTVSKRL